MMLFVAAGSFNTGSKKLATCESSMKCDVEQLSNLSARTNGSCFKIPFTPGAHY